MSTNEDEQTEGRNEPGESGSTGDDASEFSIPQRELRDPAELRALAHPVRLAIMDHLVQLGSGTATELAEQLQDESPANCSWHLRQLARYGFVEEAGSGPGRQRRWKPVIEGTTFGTGDDTPELARAVDAVDEVMLNREMARMRSWRASKRVEPARWRENTVESYSWTWMTAEEMAAFRADFGALLERHVLSRLDERVDPERRPADARPVRLVTWLIPAGPPGDAHDEETTGHAEGAEEDTDER
ncbi:winged helix-turn-helix domain-containing protein [Phytoactinopolyspora endophytica]|uniref:winged helix-turn-helix domain-containing protein n=1 Tax=Phytoactinopolyspora endophytica TaxID=1642495 RepID=UPI00101C08D4|nr:helix-turn-helix domain-containing protein [Phytoactinopolyspora endophytica]